MSPSIIIRNFVYPGQIFEPLLFSLHWHPRYPLRVSYYTDSTSCCWSSTVWWPKHIPPYYVCSIVSAKIWNFRNTNVNTRALSSRVVNNVYFFMSNGCCFEKRCEIFAIRCENLLYSFLLLVQSIHDSII